MNKILLIGAGPMAIAYAKVLQALEKEMIVVGRGAKSAEEFYRQTGIKPVEGGLQQVAAGYQTGAFTHAIVAVGVEALAGTTELLLDMRIGKILVEKPAGIDFEELNRLHGKVKQAQSKVFIAYNRRFYSAVQRLQQFIKDDGGATSMHFEFTEWAHKIEPLQKAPGVKENWFLANSTHVVDLAFYLAGKPAKMSSYTGGALSWHPISVFSGAGITDRGCLFTYSANWESAGRWQIALSTKRGIYYLSPLEELSFQQKGTVQRAPVEDINYSQDQLFKPGLINLVKSFLDGKADGILCSFDEHMENAGYYQKMINGYEQ